MKSRFFELLKKKEMQEHRTITVSEIMEETKLARNTIKAWLSDELIERIHVEAAVVLAGYVGCRWHELCEPVEVEIEN